MPRISSKKKVLAKYPEAGVYHSRVFRATIYVIIPEPYSRYALGFGYSASSAWVDAAKNIEAGKEPELLR